MGFKKSKLTLLKVLLSAPCAVYIFILVHTLSKRQLMNGSDGTIINPRSPRTFAVFLQLENSTQNWSVADENVYVNQIVNQYFILPNCDTVKGFQLYLLKYTDEPTLPTKQSFMSYLNKRFIHCQQHVPIVVNDLFISGNTTDGRLLRDIILEAYLDNVDYYYIVLADGITEKAKTEVDLSHWRDILLQRSPHGVGVIAALHSNESGSVSKLFFSKIHIEIFGTAFPFSNQTLESVLSYVAWFYSSHGMATIVYAGQHFLADQSSQHVNRSTLDWTEQHSPDSITLHRYLSAVESSRVTWRSISSSRNVIAMSLYGANRRYTIGALRNAQLLPVIFPGWHLWFYCEKPHLNGTVRYGKTPEKILQKIVELGAEIRYVDTVATGLAPMLWRFLVAEDLDVDAFEVRDCDSRLTPRDATVIAEWLKTNASFHCIRDHPSHKWHPINGGLWGGRPRGLHRALDGVTKQVMNLYGGEYFDDMRFLARQILPRVKNIAFCHDSVSCDSFPNSHPFPVKRIGFEHLGQVYDENDQVNQYDISIIAAAKVNTNCTPT